ncbi:uncharacterized protein [Euwallacea fornicatus]|uniref:uncharacterized protein n=1 Tax=Euwallacea fornicatus TaxID=995702 RepID=UPI00338DE318
MIRGLVGTALFLVIPSILLHVSGDVSTISDRPNNVCPTFDDYYTIKNNSNCWYDLSADYVAPEIIQMLGYPVQTYKVVTKDGYVLTMFRIPNDGRVNPHAKKHPVYFQHGLVATCNNFLALKKDSLAFVLWEAGYDVWLGNYRGTFPSEQHLNLTSRDPKFWETSMDDVALLDLPAMFHTILSHSEPGSQIIYVGHSLGTTFALMYGSEFPEEAKSIIKMFVLLCPAYTLNRMISPYKWFAPYGNWVIDTVRDLRLERVVSEASELSRLMTPCMESPPLMRLCMQLYNLFYGPNADFGPEMVPVYFRQLPGGTSIQILNHAADLVLGNFRKYNYPPRINMRKYGTPVAPLFDITKIEVPTYIMYSTQDWATPEEDAWNLYRNLNEKALRYCNRPGECVCKLGYYGSKCNKCIPLPGCQHGYCNASFECICQEGWDGLFCSEPICREGCHPARGYCTEPGHCKCRLGWAGRTCRECQVLPGCVHGYCEKPLECKCFPGYTGILCQTPLCSKTCHKERGYCRKPGECRCKVGWWGENCEKCFPYPGCVNGTCNRPWECNCKKGWGGMFCNEQLTYCEDNPENCKNGAKCISVTHDEGLYRCLCREGSYGRHCELTDSPPNSTVKPIRNNASMVTQKPEIPTTARHENITLIYAQGQENFVADSAMKNPKDETDNKT